MLPIRDRLRTRSVPYINYLILAVNIFVFIWERMMIGLGEHPMRLLDDYGLVPRAFLHAPLENGLSIFSRMFMHDPSGWYHIGGNMLYLWIFGDNVEDAMGHARYALFYLLSGVAAAAAQVLIDPTSTVPMVGASGAIAGVLAAYGSLYPRSPITVLNPVPLLWLFFGLFFELPAWMVIALFFVVNVMEAYLGLLSGVHGGVAVFAHLGGFVAGLFLVRLFVAQKLRRGYDAWSGFRPPRRRTPQGPWDW